MGNSHSEDGIKNKEVEKLKEQTEFSGHEIREWHKKFHEDYPDGVITKEEFVQMYRQLFPKGDATRFGQRVFEVRLPKCYRIFEDSFNRFFCFINLNLMTHCTKINLLKINQLKIVITNIVEECSHVEWLVLRDILNRQS